MENTLLLEQINDAQYRMSLDGRNVIATIVRYGAKSCLIHIIEADNQTTIFHGIYDIKEGTQVFYDMSGDYAVDTTPEDDIATERFVELSKQLIERIQ